MRQILFISTILFLLNSCRDGSSEKVTVNNENSASIEVIEFDRDFNVWLTKQGLERIMIHDTTRKSAFELWSYREKLTESDSAFYWYPSKDSSYFLITNFNQVKKHRIGSENSNDINLRFLKKNNQDVYLGITLIDSLEQRSIDFYWYDSTTFFFIEKGAHLGDRTLTRLKMGVDSIWTYKIEK